MSWTIAPTRRSYPCRGDYLKTLREKRGLTQTELAGRSGVPQSEISRIERGSVHPTERTLVRLADALDADLVLVERDRHAATG